MVRTKNKYLPSCLGFIVLLASQFIGLALLTIQMFTSLHHYIVNYPLISIKIRSELSTPGKISTAHNLSTDLNF